MGLGKCSRCDKEWTEFEKDTGDKIYNGADYYCRKCVTEIRCALEERFGHYLLEHNYGTSFMMDVCDWAEVLDLIKFNPDMMQFEIKMSDLLKLGFIVSDDCRKLREGSIDEELTDECYN